MGINFFRCLKWVILHDYAIFYKDWSRTSPDQTRPPKLARSSQGIHQDWRVWSCLQDLTGRTIGNPAAYSKAQLRITGLAKGSYPREPDLGCGLPAFQDAAYLWNSTVTLLVPGQCVGICTSMKLPVVITVVATKLSGRLTGINYQLFL